MFLLDKNCEIRSEISTKHSVKPLQVNASEKLETIEHKTSLTSVGSEIFTVTLSFGATHSKALQPATQKTTFCKQVAKFIKLHFKVQTRVVKGADDDSQPIFADDAAFSSHKQRFV